MLGDVAHILVERSIWTNAKIFFMPKSDVIADSGVRSVLAFWVSSVQC